MSDKVEGVLPNAPPTNSEVMVASRTGEAAEEHSPPVGNVTPIGKQTVSAGKAAANRANSMKSTGPKTSTGKRTVSLNAFKHGFFARFLLIPHPDGNESHAEYDELYQALRRHFRPMNLLEELLTEKVAVWSWRLRRLLRSESGLLARALATASLDSQQSKADDEAKPGLGPASSPEIDAMRDHLFLPEREEVDRLLRYESMITRQLNHGLAELERLQARRKGGSTIPGV